MATTVLQKLKEKLKSRRRDRDLLRLYGISLARYKEMLKLSNGRCWICNRPPKKSLHVDHDHKTGRVRGLLCWLCNRKLIGRRRDPELFELAAAYLRRGIDFRDETAMTAMIQVSATAVSVAEPSEPQKPSAGALRRRYVHLRAR